ncbi:MAG: efflux RND transporter periplasmic adaptor subunit [Pseudomonadota bacterium]
MRAASATLSRHLPRPIQKAFIVVALLLAGCSSGEGGAPPPPPPAAVTYVTVASSSVATLVELPGRVAAVRTAEVRARIDGIVERKLYVEGSDISRGASLFRIDPRPLRAALDIQLANARSAQAEVDNAAREVQRYAPLVAVDAISKQEYDAARARLAKAQAAVGSAQAQIRQARLTLNYTNVTAPISGRVGRAEVTEGALASQSAGTLLTRIEQLDPVYVNFTQSSEELARLRGGVAGAGRGLSPTVTVLMDNGQPYGMTGSLNFLDQSVDPTTGSVGLRATFRNPGRQLLPGQFVRVRVQTGSNPNGIAVPQRAVQITQQGGSVMILGPGNIAQPRPVKLGVVEGDRWVILSGLKSGDKVIVDGLQKVMPGAKVDPKPLGAARPPYRRPAPAPANAR